MEVHSEGIEGVGPGQPKASDAMLKTMKNDLFVPLTFTTAEGEKIEFTADRIKELIQNLYEALFAGGACNYSTQDDSRMPAYQAAVVAVALALVFSYLESRQNL